MARTTTARWLTGVAAFHPRCVPAWLVGVALLTTTLFAGFARAGPGKAGQHVEHAHGSEAFAVSCSPPAQAQFNRAVALLHHMTYPQARDAFRQVARTDPGCAMAHWGIAMTLFQPLWPTRPKPAELQLGWDEVRNANALRPATKREQLFVATTAAFFREPSSPDYWARIRRWEAASGELYAAFPDDADAGAFYALALLATAPAATVSRDHADRAAAILLRIHRHHPDHPGAMHYLVHANDTPGREHDSPEVIHQYETVAPDNAHALHMPTHIYTRVGDWNGVIRGNLRAAEAALGSPAGDHGELVSDEFPHAIEYLVYAYLQIGADHEADAQTSRLHATTRLEPTFKTAFHLASTQARYALERRDWSAAAAIVPRADAGIDWNRFAWPEAISWFAKGLGAAHLGRIDQAHTAMARLAVLEATSDNAGEMLFAHNIRMLRLELSGWTGHAEGNRPASLNLMQEAADLEAATPKHAVTPAPTLPAQEMLGDLLMEQAQPAMALVAYQRAIALYPRRFNATLGAARAARASGNATLAGRFYRSLLDIAQTGNRQAPLAEAREYLASRP